jgi:hypothetical protein
MKMRVSGKFDKTLSRENSEREREREKKKRHTQTNLERALSVCLSLSPKKASLC